MQVLERGEVCDVGGGEIKVRELICDVGVGEIKARELMQVLSVAGEDVVFL